MEDCLNTEDYSVIVTVLENNKKAMEWVMRDRQFSPSPIREQQQSESAAAKVVQDFLNLSRLGETAIGFVEETERFRSFVVLPRADISKLGVDEKIFEMQDPFIFFGNYECWGVNELIEAESEAVMIQLCEFSAEDAAIYHRAGWASASGSFVLSLSQEE